jgi:hypothetical protein
MVADMLANPPKLTVFVISTPSQRWGRKFAQLIVSKALAGCDLKFTITSVREGNMDVSHEQPSLLILSSVASSSRVHEERFIWGRDATDWI